MTTGWYCTATATAAESRRQYHVLQHGGDAGTGHTLPSTPCTHGLQSARTRNADAAAGGLLFCQLLRGDLPSHRVYADDRFTVLLTIYPINPGHLMVVTNEHIESFYDVDDALYIPLLLLVKRMALVIKAAFAPLQVIMETSGITNHHVHIHVLPVYGNYDRVPQEMLERQLARPAPEAELIRVLEDLKRYLATHP